MCSRDSWLSIADHHFAIHEIHQNPDECCEQLENAVQQSSSLQTVDYVVLRGLAVRIFQVYVFDMHLLVQVINYQNRLYIEFFGYLFSDFSPVGARVEFSGNESMKEETLTAPTKSRRFRALHDTCCRKDSILEFSDTEGHSTSPFNDVNVDV